MPNPADPVVRLTQELRIRVGNPDDEELTDVELAYHLKRALSQVNRDDPARKIGSFTTVAGQSSYDVVPSDAFRVIEVFYSPGLGGPGWVPEPALSELYAYDASLEAIGAGAKIFDNPAMVEIFYKKLSSFRQYFGGHGGPPQRVPADDGTVWLTPTPCSACTVWFIFTAPRFATLEDVQEYWEEYLLLYAEHLVLKGLANKRSEIVGGESAGGGSWRSGGGRMQQDLAGEALARYQREFRNKPVGPRLGR